GGGTAPSAAVGVVISAIAKPIPASSNGTTSCPYPVEVVATTANQVTPTPSTSRPVTISNRWPTRSDSAPASGVTISGIAIIGRNRSPAPNGEAPRTYWKYSDT